MNRHRKNLNPSLKKRPAEEVDRTVYVGHLHYRVTKKELQDHFSRIGGVSNITIKRRGDEHRAYSFVTFDDSSSAKEALKLNKSKIEGKFYSIIVYPKNVNGPPTQTKWTSNNQGLANGSCGEARAATIASNNQGPPGEVGQFYNQGSRFGPPDAVPGQFYHQGLRYGPPAATGQFYNHQGARYGLPGPRRALHGHLINPPAAPGLHNQGVRYGLPGPRRALHDHLINPPAGPGLHNQGVIYGLPGPRGALHGHLINPPAAPGLHNQGVRYGLPGPKGALHGHLINPPAAPGLHNQGVIYGLPGPNGPSHNQGPENSSKFGVYKLF